MEQPTKTRKMSVSADDIELLLSVQCRYNLCLLDMRHKVTASDLESEADDTEIPETLRGQHKISKFLIKNDNFSSLVSEFMCDCYRYSCSQIPDVIVVFSGNDLVFREKRPKLTKFVKKQVQDILGTI